MYTDNISKRYVCGGMDNITVKVHYIQILSLYWTKSIPK